MSKDNQPDDKNTSDKEFARRIEATTDSAIHNTPIHACPPEGSGIMPCCGCTPFEKIRDRITDDPRLATCGRIRAALRAYVGED